MKQFLDVNWRHDRPTSVFLTLFLRAIPFECYLKFLTRFGSFLCGNWFEYESKRGGVAGYKTMPFGICEIVLNKDVDLPVSQWLQMVTFSTPNASSTYPPPVGLYGEDSWENMIIGECNRWCWWFR